jgi:hypothetical protein
MADTNMFGFGENDDNIGKKSKAWKAEGGRQYRVSFAWWNVVDGKFDLSAKSPKFAGAQINYIPGAGYIVNKGPEYTKIAGEPPKQRILTLLVLWPTDKKGQVDKARLSTDFEVVPWLFSGDKYNTLKQIHSEFSFGEHDLTITCTDTGFQKMTFAPCKESLLKSIQASDKGKAVLDRIIGEVELLAAGANDQIGREMSVQALREKLAGGGGGGAGNSSPADAATTSNIDSVVDDLLG